MTMIWVFLDSNHLYSRMKMIGGCERFKSGQSGASEQNIETEMGELIEGYIQINR